jgi:hypothetical protein
MRIARKVALGVGDAEGLLTAPTLRRRRAWLRGRTRDVARPSLRHSRSTAGRVGYLPSSGL